MEAVNGMAGRANWTTKQFLLTEIDFIMCTKWKRSFLHFNSLPKTWKHSVFNDILLRFVARRATCFSSRRSFAFFNENFSFIYFYFSLCRSLFFSLSRCVHVREKSPVLHLFCMLRVHSPCFLFILSFLFQYFDESTKCTSQCKDECTKKRKIFRFFFHLFIENSCIHLCVTYTMLKRMMRKLLHEIKAMLMMMTKTRGKERTNAKELKNLKRIEKEEKNETKTKKTLSHHNLFFSHSTLTRTVFTKLKDYSFFYSIFFHSSVSDFGIIYIEFASLKNKNIFSSLFAHWKTFVCDISFASNFFSLHSNAELECEKNCRKWMQVFILDVDLKFYLNWKWRI